MTTLCILSAVDCWELGRQAYLIGEDETTMNWMEESLRRFHQEPDNDKTVHLKDILKYYTFSSLNQGRYFTSHIINTLPY